MEHKKIENQKNRINLEKINIAEYNEQDRKAIKEFSKMPDYYKILGVKENATLDEIKQASEKKIEQYNPDNIDLKKKLKSLPENERLKESNKNNDRIIIYSSINAIFVLLVYLTNTNINEHEIFFFTFFHTFYMVSFTFHIKYIFIIF